MRDVVEALTAFEDRGACTDAERRAALWLHDDLRARGCEAWVETLWVRPQRAGSLFVHAALGMAASLASTAVPALALIAFPLALSLALEQAGVPVLARLFYRRATQTVMVEPPAGGIRLWLVARTDTDRSGGWRLASLPWRALVIVALLWIVGMGAVRASGTEGGWIGAVQLVPTVVLLVAAAVAVDLILSDWASGTAEAGGAAVALALHEELLRNPPARLSPGLLLCPPVAFRSWRRAERPVAADTVIVELRKCESGAVAWTARHPQLAAAAGDPGRAGTSRGLPTLTVTGGDLDAVYDFVAATVDRLDASLLRSSATVSAAS